MHLVPSDRANLHTINGRDVCDAIGSLGRGLETVEWAKRFAVLGDPTRLALLLCIQRVPDICVTDLSVAVGMKDPAVSQSLRLLRMQGLVTQRRDERVIRYRLASGQIEILLGYVTETLSVRSQPASGHGH